MSKKQKVEEITKKQKEKLQEEKEKQKTEKKLDSEKKKHIKKWGNSIPKKISAVKTKFYSSWDGLEGEAIVEDNISNELFNEIFTGVGKKIQPTPDNKPTSVTILQLNTWKEIRDFFGESCPSQGGHEGNLWNKGGNFQKACRLGKVNVKIDSMEVEYNKTKMVLELKFKCSRE